MNLKDKSILATLTAVLTAPLRADTGKVELPENYASKFVRYTSVDKPDIDEPEKTKMRFFYINPESLAAAVAGQPLPAGTVLIMEDHAVEREMRNGEWEYAWFDAEGNRREDKSMDGCFTCHKGTAATD